MAGRRGGRRCDGRCGCTPCSLVAGVLLIGLSISALLALVTFRGGLFPEPPPATAVDIEVHDDVGPHHDPHDDSDIHHDDDALLATRSVDPKNASVSAQGGADEREAERRRNATIPLARREFLESADDDDGDDDDGQIVGHKLRVLPLYQLDGLDATKAAFVRESLMPVSIEALTRTFALKDPPPKSSRLVLPRLCKTWLTWSTGETECKELGASTCGSGTIGNELFAAARECSGQRVGDCEEVTGGDGALADFVLIVTASESGANCDANSGGESAQGGYCITDDATGRPIAGFINFCPGTISLAMEEMGRQVDLAVHEMLHAIVFEPSLFDQFQHASDAYRSVDAPVLEYVDGATGEVTSKVLRTPAVRAFVRDHFGCSSLEGAELENEGGEGTRWSHWEESLFLEEIMTGLQSPSERSVLSNLTLALLEDSGWYVPNYALASKPLAFGKGAGCAWVRDKCRGAMGASEWYCEEPGRVSCTHSRHALGRCEVNPLANGCGIAKGYSNYACADVGKDVEHTPMQSFGASSVCVRGEDERAWVREDQEFVDDRVMTVQTTFPSASSGCFRMECDDGEVPYVKFGERRVACEPGAMIDLKDFGFKEGVFGPCPDRSVCDRLSCRPDCGQHGTCHLGACYCDLGWLGAACDRPITPEASHAPLN